jgi:hypothetical protein
LKIAAVLLLLEGWFDPIETQLRNKDRAFIEEIICGESRRDAVAARRAFSLGHL